MKKKWVVTVTLLGIFLFSFFTNETKAFGYTNDLSLSSFNNGNYYGRLPNGTYSITLPGHHSTQPIAGYTTRVLEINGNNELVASNFCGSINQRFTFIYDCYFNAYKIYNYSYYGNMLLTGRQVYGRPNPAVVAEVENPYKKNCIDYYWYVEPVSNGNFLIRNAKNPSLVIDLIGNNPFLDTRFQLIRQQPLNSVHTTAQQVNFKLIY